MAHIRPITDLRNTSEISSLCKETCAPIFITKNGYGDMVIMSSETYEKELAMGEIYRKLLLAQKQADEGDTVDCESFFRQMRKKYNYEV